VVTVLSYWTDAVPKAAWISIFWVIIILINVWVVRFFAEVEVFSSTVKFGWMIVAIIALTGEKDRLSTIEPIWLIHKSCHLRRSTLGRAYRLPLLERAAIQ